MSRGHADSLGLDPGTYRVDRPRLVGDHYEAAVRLTPHANPECPECRGGSVVQGERPGDVYHEPFRRKPLILKLVKERYQCRECGRTFDIDQPLLSGITPHVSALCAEFISERISEGATVARIEHECGAQKSIVAKVEAGIDLPRPRLPRHLCIDEVRGFKKKTAIAHGLPHMCTCIYNAERRTLADMLPGDKPGVVRPYVESFTKAERNAVESVSCDLNGSYIKMARELFPRAAVYADKFHVSKLVAGAVDEVRQALRRKLDAARKAGEDALEDARDDGAEARRKRDPGAASDAGVRAAEAKDRLSEAKSRLKALDGASKLMLERREELTPGQRAKVDAAFRLEGADEVRRAYLALQLFYEWSDRTYPTRPEMADALHEWARAARRSNVRAMRRAAKTITSRQNLEHVLNGWDHGRTNAVAESLNHRIKDVIRDARGFRSFEGLRRRCLLVLGHERAPHKPIPLFKRRGKKAEGGDAG